MNHLKAGIMVCAVPALLMFFSASAIAGPLGGYNPTSPSHSTTPSKSASTTGANGNSSVTTPSGSTGYGNAPSSSSADPFPDVLNSWQSSSALWNGGTPQSAWTPRYSGENFTILQLGFDTSPHLGCGDFEPGDLAANAKSEVTGMYYYIRKNALSMVVTYLLYSQPTLSSAMQWLQNHVDKLTQLTVASCDSIEAAGSDQAEAQILADAKRACLNDNSSGTNTPSMCSSPSVLEKYVNKEATYDNNVLGDAVGSLSSIGTAAYKTTSVNSPYFNWGGVSTGSSGPGSGGATFGGGSFAMPACAHTGSCGTQDLISSAIVDPEVRSLVPQLIGNTTIDTSSPGQIRMTPRSGSVAALAANVEPAFQTMVDNLVSQSPDQIANESTSALMPFYKYPGITAPPPQLVARLQVLKSSDPNTYQNAVEVLGTSMTTTYLNQVYNEIQAGESSALASVPSNVLPAALRDPMQQQVIALRAEINAYVDSVKAKEAGLLTQKDLYNSLTSG